MLPVDVGTGLDASERISLGSWTRVTSDESGATACPTPTCGVGPCDGEKGGTYLRMPSFSMITL